MGENNPVLYLFDAMKKIWSQKTAVPHQIGLGFCIAAGNNSLYVVGGSMKICWQYQFTTDSWVKLSSPALKHVLGASIFHQNSLLLLGGYTEDNIEGYSIDRDMWVMAPFKMPDMVVKHYAFMMDLETENV